MNRIRQRNNSGFTLIELVVVIVILSTLSAFVLPEFIEFSSDADRASTEALKGGLQSSASLYHSKAMIEPGGTNNGFTYQGVFFDQGYPLGISFGDSDGIPEILEITDISDDYVFATVFNDRTAANQISRGLYLTNKLTNTSPSAADVLATNCYVTYKTHVTVALAPEIIIELSGC
ncbi:type II secretion system protein [Bacterioplanoides sp.]|uniref:type II secretion system protein n=1 Tax=Bacterioplanoides sp. TaxID=2066072 RepID=UPI003AFF983A